MRIENVQWSQCQHRFEASRLSSCRRTLALHLARQATLRVLLRRGIVALRRRWLLNLAATAKEHV